MTTRPTINGHFIRQNERRVGMNPDGSAWKNVYVDPKVLTEFLYDRKGTWITYEWSRLEPQRRQYDFSELDRQVAYLTQAHPDVHIVIQLSDQSYNPSLVSPPDWLGSARLEKKSQDGWVAATWHESVMDEFIRLHFEVMHRYRDVTQFYGTATSETTIGFQKAEDHKRIGYTEVKRIETLTRLVQTLAIAFPHKRVWFMQNFLPGGTPEQLLEMCLKIAAPPYEAAIGGPDLVPMQEGLSSYHKQMAEALDKRVYQPIYMKLPDWVLKFCSAQYETFRSTHPRDVVQLALRLGLHAVIWNNARFEKPYHISDAVPYFEQPLKPGPAPYKPPRQPLDPRLVLASEALDKTLEQAEVVRSQLMDLFKDFNK